MLARGTLVGRAAAHSDGVSLSVLLRLIPGPLADGQLVGELEMVKTGERVRMQSTEQLIAYLQRCALAEDQSRHCRGTQPPAPAACAASSDHGGEDSRSLEQP